VADHPVKVPPELVKEWLIKVCNTPITVGEVTTSLADRAALNRLAELEANQ